MLVNFPPLISIIVPVYNGGKYLAYCLNSINDQSLSEIEVILIDDGSTDNSLDICNNFAKNKPNWIVHSKINEGQGVARNQGLEIASGEFILFVDCDDWIERNTCKDLFNVMRKSKADFLNFGFNFFSDCQKIIKEVSKFTIKSCVGLEIFHKALLDSDVLSISWNKLYRRKFLVDNKIFFPALRVNEDIFFSRAVALASQECVFINKVYYHALVRPGSTSRSMSVNLYRETKVLLSYERRYFFLVKSATRNIFRAHVVKLWTYLIIQGSFRIKDLDEFMQCIKIAEDSNFLLYSNSSLVMKHLPLKSKLLVFFCRRPSLLLLISKLLKRFGIQPY